MLLYVALRNLLRHARRSFALSVTLAVGTGALFLFDGFNTGILNQYRDNAVHARYGDAQVNVRGYRLRPFEKPWEQWIDLPLRVEAQLRAVPGVQQVFPRVTVPGFVLHNGATYAAVGFGVDAAREATFFTTLNIVEGTDLGADPDGIILGVGLARALNVKPGDRIKLMSMGRSEDIAERPFTVRGIFHTGSKEVDDVHFRVPLRAAQALLDIDRVECFALAFTAGADFAAIERAIVAAFPALEVTPFNVLDEIYYQHAVDWLSAQFGVIKLIILVVVVLGIFNTVNTTVLERRAEFGMLRAYGESRFDVLVLLLAEAVLLGLVGAWAGVLIAWALVAGPFTDGILMPAAPGLTRQYLVQIELTLPLALSAVLLGASCAPLATLAAGWRAVRTPIADALRAY